LFGDDTDNDEDDLGQNTKDVLVCAIEKEAHEQTSNVLRQLMSLLEGNNAVMEHDVSSSEMSLTSRLQRMEKETAELCRSTKLLKEKKIDMTSLLLSRITEQRNKMMVAMRKIKLNEDIHARDIAVAEWLQQSFATLESSLKLERLKAVNRVSIYVVCPPPSPPPSLSFSPPLPLLLLLLLLLFLLAAAAADRPAVLRVLAVIPLLALKKKKHNQTTHFSLLFIPFLLLLVFFLVLSLHFKMYNKGTVPSLLRKRQQLDKNVFTLGKEEEELDRQLALYDCNETQSCDDFTTVAREFKEVRSKIAVTRRYLERVSEEYERLSSVRLKSCVVMTEKERNDGNFVEVEER